MRQSLSEPISVELITDHRERTVFPRRLLWRNRTYRVKKVGLHHAFYQGKVRLHVFSVVANGLFFRLVLNTENLSWKVEDVADGLPG